MGEPTADLGDGEEVRACMESRGGRTAEEHHAPQYRPFGSVVSFDLALGEGERSLLLGLEACVRGTGNHIEDRNFEYSEGGNNVTYLNEFLQRELPDLTARIRDVAQGAVEAAEWSAAIPRLGIRCVELLRYESADGFSEVGFHEDGESTYTMVFMLSEPGRDYTGGAFEIKNKRAGSGRTTLERVELGHGFLFDSETKHRVSTVSSGIRTVLVLEFWELADSTSFDFRPGREYGKPLKLEL